MRVSHPIRLPGIVLCWLLGASSAAQPAGYAVSPRPDFASPGKVDVRAEAPENQVSEGLYWLLIDEQEDIGSLSQYRHHAWKVVSESGLEGGSGFSITYDTSYQSLAVHGVTLWRQGAPRSRLRKLRPTQLRREPDLEGGMLDGRQTLHFSLEDVRVGDAIEYEYTLRGVNPIFRDKASGSSILQYAIPVERIRVRLLCPAGRDLQMLRRNGAGPYQSLAAGGKLEYLWDLAKVPALEYDGDAPSWYDAFPRVQWGEYRTWADVVAWAESLYTLKQPLAPELIGLADSFRGLDKREQIRRALRVVQDEVRYLGLEMGPSSHRPAHPNLVYRRRFGDCKDKTLLFCALLGKLGMEAVPVLVNTRIRGQVAEYQPSPLAFDHVIARVALDGKHYWFDATRSQLGDPLQLQILPYEKGLPIVAGNRDFDDIEMTDAEKGRLDIVQAFRIPRWDSTADLQVTSVYAGFEADDIRSRFAASSRAEREREYLNYYAAAYPHIRSAGPVQVKDDSAGNRITLVESYFIDSLCIAEQGSGQLACSLPAQDIAAFLAAPDRKIRKSPYALRYPKNVSQELRLFLPERMSLPPDRGKAGNQDFEFTWDEVSSGKNMVLRYTYATYQDHVPLRRFPEYLKALDAIQANLGATLYPGGSAGGFSPNYLLFFYTAFCLGAAAWIASKSARRDMTAPFFAPSAGPPLPIGGLLVLFGIGVFLRPFLLLYNLRESAQVFNYSSWHYLTAPGSSGYHPFWAPVVLGEIMANAVLLCLSFALWPLFMGRRRNLPVMFALLVAFGLLIGVADILASALIPAAASPLGRVGTWRSLIQDTFLSLLWCAYLLRSGRSTATFVVRAGPGG